MSKKFIVKNYKNVFKGPYMGDPEKEMTQFNGDDDMQVSDGYHTMDELYEHRIVLYIALCRTIDSAHKGSASPVWRTELHSDGSKYEGWFILGLYQDNGSQITYHLPLEFWDNTNFAVDLDKAPEWDGHTSQAVLDRLLRL